MKSSIHIAIECALGLAIVVMGMAFAYNYHQHALDAAKVEAKVEGRAEQQKQDDDNLKQIQTAKAAGDARNEQLQKKLQEATSQQVVSQAPQFVAGIPASSRPITIWQPGVTPPESGDAIVPADQIKPIAAQILAGNNCIVNSLPSCVKERDVWEHKFTLEQQTSSDWKTLAKGGGFGKKLKRCSIIGGVNFGFGYGVTQTTPTSDPRLRNGMVLGVGNAALCMFLK